MSVINTNITSMIGQQNLRESQNNLQTSMERLSSGLRINSAKDDAAGQAIANRMSSQITGLAQAQRNSNDGISVAQTAEGGLNQINDNLQRIRELSVQAQNGTNSENDLQSIQDEVNQRLSEINRISEETDFNGERVLSGDAGTLSIQVGANDGQTIDVNLETVNAETLGLDAFNVNGQVENELATTDDLNSNANFNSDATLGENGGFTTTGNIGVAEADLEDLGYVEAADQTVVAAGMTEYSTDVNEAATVDDLAGYNTSVDGQGVTTHTEYARASLDDTLGAMQSDDTATITNTGLTNNSNDEITYTAQTDGSFVSTETITNTDGETDLANATLSMEVDGTMQDVVFDGSGNVDSVGGTSIDGSSNWLAYDEAASGSGLTISTSDPGDAGNPNLTNIADVAGFGSVATAEGVTFSGTDTSDTDLSYDFGGTDDITRRVEGLAESDVRATVLDTDTTAANTAIEVDGTSYNYDSGDVTTTSGSNAVYLNSDSELTTTDPEEFYEYGGQVYGDYTSGDRDTLGNVQYVDASGDFTADQGGESVYANADGQVFTNDDESGRQFFDENGSVTGEDGGQRTYYAVTNDAGEVTEYNTAEDGSGDSAYIDADGNYSRDEFSIDEDEKTSDPLASLDSALSQVDSLRSDLGAVQNRFESAIENLSTNETNLSAARSRIEDADYAMEVADMTRSQILQQAGTSVLAQANQIPQNVLSLLG